MLYKKLNGVKTYAPTKRQELITFAFENKSILIAVNAEKILNANEESRDIINRNLGYPDGVGAVWALKSKGIKNVEKIPGCELWLDIIKQYHAEETFYFLGSKQEVIESTIVKLKLQYPSINIVNYRNGYIKDENEQNLLLADITKKKPSIIFVAMGSPRQELLMELMHQTHPALYQGLGGSFDVFTGNVKRAPKWWVNNNLEWAYRLVKQPKRILRQFKLIRFLYLLKFNKL